MNINYKQSQFELFPGAPGSAADINKPRFLFAKLTLSAESSIIMSICVFMSIVLSYSLGVERGRRIVPLAKNAVTTENKRIQEKTQTQVVTPPAEIKKTSTEMKNNIQLFPQISAPENVASIPPVIAGSYTIQIASYKTQKAAEREAVKFKDKGQDTFILSKGDYFILCVGKFPTSQEAKVLASRLKKQYTDNLIRRL